MLLTHITRSLSANAESNRVKKVSLLARLDDLSSYASGFAIQRSQRLLCGGTATPPQPWFRDEATGTRSATAAATPSMATQVAKVGKKRYRVGGTSAPRSDLARHPTRSQGPSLVPIEPACIDPGRRRVFARVSLTPLDPVIQLAGPIGEAEAADFVMAMGPLARVLPSLSTAQRENVRATLEVYFSGHTTSQGVVLRPRTGWSGRAFDAAALPLTTRCA